MLIDKYEDRLEVIKYVNTLDGYRGYVQFSDRPLNKKDIFEDRDPNITLDENGFIYEAHFCNDKKSIMIRQQNAEWMVSTTDISDIDEKDMEYFAFEKTAHLKEMASNWVKTAQIWESKEDELCEDMNVMKLQKVVFVGFSVDKKQGEV